MYEIKKIKRILCYGDSNTWGWVPSSMGSKRFDLDNRWPGIIQKKLGDEYIIIEEGLGARTTMFDDPRPDLPLRNGLQMLPAILDTHLPLDLVIVMLGTTDTKEMLDKEPVDIQNGMSKIIDRIREHKVLGDCNSPKILVVVPPIVTDSADFASKLFSGGTMKGLKLKSLYKDLTEEKKVYFLDPTNDVNVDSKEGVHLDSESHKKLAKLIYDKINKIFN